MSLLPSAGLRPALHPWRGSCCRAPPATASSKATAAAAACCASAPCARKSASRRPDAHGEHDHEPLRAIHALIAALIAEFLAHGVAIESVFTAINHRTALRLAEVRGVILLAASQARIPAFSYSPRQIKASVAGYGQADKSQVQQMVRALLGMSETPEPADAADALAVALCHVQAAEAQARMIRAGSKPVDASLFIRRRTRRARPQPVTVSRP